MTMTQMDDTMRKLTLGDPDGPMKFIDTLGREVPTYIDPREELIPPTARAFKRLNHHVPFNMRNEFKPAQWPVEYQRTCDRTVSTDIEGFVLCAGITKAGAKCSKRAVNRSHFCRNHGGALHPADKKIHINTKGLEHVPERVAQLGRIKRFYQGFLKPEDLDDDEVQQGFVRDDDGRTVPAKAMGIKWEQAIAKELHRRLNDYLKSKASSMLHVMVDIAENDLYEAADRIKAAQWVAERTIGKTPEVIVHGTTKAPYESILEGIGSGSREENRQSRQVAIERLAGSPDEILDVEIEPDDSEYGEGDRSTQTDAAVRFEGSEDNALHSETEMVADSGAVEAEKDAKEAADDLEQRRKTKIERSAAIKKAKQRRFAARAVGAKNLDNAPWLIDFKAIRGSRNFRCVLVSPNAQTPALVERIMLQYEKMRNQSEKELQAEIDRRVAQDADADVLRLQAQLAKLTAKN